MIHTTITLTFYRFLWGSKVNVDFDVQTPDPLTSEEVNCAACIEAPSLSPGSDWYLWEIKFEQPVDCAD